jgi:hypothetical protein
MLEILNFGDQHMMFIKKALLGSLIFATVMAAGIVRGAIAQYVQKSERFLSDQEIQSLESKFQSYTASRGGGPAWKDSRKSSEVLQITDFVNGWQKIDSSIAPFLGNWEGFEENLLVYPSINRRKVCVIYRFNENGYHFLFNIGKIVGNKLVSDGQFGKSIIIRNTAPDRSGNKATFLASYVSYRNSGTVNVYAFPTKLKAINDNRFTRLGCTASLPSQVQFNR